MKELPRIDQFKLEFVQLSEMPMNSKNSMLNFDQDIHNDNNNPSMEASSY